jgi:hypothetical protein
MNIAAVGTKPALGVIVSNVHYWGGGGLGWIVKRMVRPVGWVTTQKLNLGQAKRGLCWSNEARSWVFLCIWSCCIEAEMIIKFVSTRGDSSICDHSITFLMQCESAWETADIARLPLMAPVVLSLRFRVFWSQMFILMFPLIPRAFQNTKCQGRAG